MKTSFKSNILRRGNLTSIRTPTLRLYLCIAATAVGGILVLTVPTPASALNLYDGSSAGNNLEINLTTTVEYSGFLRVNNPSAILAGPTNANGNDGDSNFRHGLVGNQFYVEPVLDIRDGDYGAHFSGEAYLNTSYLGTNQNDQPGTLNSIFVAKNTDFTSATRNVNGENAEVLDAFGYAQHEFSDGQSLQLKVGRSVLNWGQSLFSASDGIAGGMSPINIILAQNIANPQANQIYLPVGQAIVTYQPGIHNITIQGYYQFEYEHDQFQGAGSYFNSSDLLDKGAQSLILASGVYALRDKDLLPEHQNGDFGLSLQSTIGNYDFGVYVLRFDAKAPSIYLYPGQGLGTSVPGGIQDGTYQLVYPRDIWLEGVSLSTTVGDANVGGEISTRQHMPLLGGLGIPSAGNPGNANSDPLYPVGNTLAAQVSTIYISPGIPLDPGGVTIDAEAVATHLINVTDNRAALVTGHQGTAASFDIAVTPTYYSVLPNLQVTFPISLSYNFLGRSEWDSTQYHGTGTLDLGVTATYRANYIASLTYQDYLGKPDPTYNGLADRGFVSLNLQHTF